MEDLSNELLYEIFEFLDYFHVYDAFFTLNIRFRNLLTHSNLPINIDLSSVSKSAWKRFNADIVETNMDRISTVRISDPYMYDLVLLPIGKLWQFDRVETLVLDNIESECLEPLLTELSALSLLSSLAISTIDHVSNQNSIYQQIFGLPALKYCKLSFLRGSASQLLPIATDAYSPIEHLIITHSIDLHQLDGLLSYVPHLRRLSLYFQQYNGQKWTPRCPLIFNQLTHLYLQLDCVRYDVFEGIIREVFPMIEVCHLTTKFGITSDSVYINAKTYEQLITTYMPNLRIFDVQFEAFRYPRSSLPPIENEINQFSSSFWIARQWFFSKQIFWLKYGECTLFYSTNPYRYASIDYVFC